MKKTIFFAGFFIFAANFFFAADEGNTEKATILA